MTNFTVVITTYNRLSFLKRAILSVINQSINCEIIVVDDCSSDGTLDYLKSLGNSIKWHHNEQNLGHSSSVNRGVEMSQSDWIKLLDDDDYLSPNCLEIMNQAIKKNPQAVICSCQAIKVNKQGEKIGQTKIVKQGELVYIFQEDIHYNMLLDQLPFGTPVQVAFRKDAFVKSGGWDTCFDEVQLYDEIDSWLRIANFGDAMFINKPLVYRTIWSEGINQKYSLEKRLEYNILIKGKIDDLVNPKYDNIRPKMSAICDYLRLYWGLIALKQKQVIPFGKMAFPVMFNPLAWWLLIKVVLARKNLKLSSLS